jgi:hypothetical protein
MKAKKVMGDEHGPRHVTPAGRSVFYDLFPKAEADELVMRSTLLRGLEMAERKQPYADSSREGAGHHAGSGVRYQAR